MSATQDILPELSAVLAENGLILRGGFNFDAGEDAPDGLSGARAQAVVLVGQAGASTWPYFSRWHESQPEDLADPLDTWSRQVTGAAAEKFAARAVGPNDKPYLPFQQWAMRAERLKPSPLGILMHPRYGLWHAFRGALLFENEISFPAAETPVHPCDACVDKPCLKSCPVDAYSPDGFAYRACLAHVRGSRGDSCRVGGCLDRNACPHGVHYRYPQDMQAFHMKAFAW
jgi:ferredoxin